MLQRVGQGGNEVFEVSVLQGLPDLRIAVLAQGVKVHAQAARKDHRVLRTIRTTVDNQPVNIFLGSPEDMNDDDR